VAKFTNLTSDVRYIVHGLPGVRAILPGDVAEVADDVAESYASQPEIWGAVCDVAKTAVADIAQAASEAAAAAVTEPVADVVPDVAPIAPVKATQPVPAPQPSKPVAEPAATDAPSGV
jgi:cell division septation protein DedD